MVVGAIGLGVGIGFRAAMEGSRWRSRRSERRGEGFYIIVLNR